MANETIVVLYCGSSFTKHLYDVLLELNTFPIMLPAKANVEIIADLNPDGIIITGSGQDVNLLNAPKVHKGIYELNIPVLGICYGMQLMAKEFGGEVKRMVNPETDYQHLNFTENKSIIYQNFTDEGAPVKMAHTCKVTKVPNNFVITGYTDATEVASMEHNELELYGVQFHPEYKSNQAGISIIWSWLKGVCGCQG